MIRLPVKRFPKHAAAVPKTDVRSTHNICAISPRRTKYRAMYWRRHTLRGRVIIIVVAWRERSTVVSSVAKKKKSVITIVQIIGFVHCANSRSRERPLEKRTRRSSSTRIIYYYYVDDRSFAFRRPTRWRSSNGFRRIDPKTIVSKPFVDKTCA